MSDTPSTKTTVWTTPVILLLIASVAVIMLFAQLGQYAHPAADDYCMAVGVEQNGLIPHLWQHYLEWSGRYTGNSLYALYPMITGLYAGYSILPSLLIIALLLATAFFISSVFRLKMMSSMVWIASIFLVAVYLLGIRHTASSLYWMSGSLTYQTANILLLLLLGLAIRLKGQLSENQHTTGTVIVISIVTMLAIGTNELNLVAVCLLLGLLFLIQAFSDRSKLRPWIWLLLVAALCSSVVYFSPGTVVRESTFPMRHDFSRAISGTFNMGWWALKAWIGVPLMIIASLVMPFVVAMLYRSSSHPVQPGKLFIAGLLITTLATPFVLLFPAWWAMGAWPPPRTVDGIFFIFNLGWFATIGAMTLRFLNHKAEMQSPASVLTSNHTWFLVASILLVIAIGINGKFRRVMNDMTEHAPAFHEYIQQRHHLIESAVARQQAVLVVPAYPGKFPRSVFFNDITRNPTDWRNVCYAEYHGLQQISRQARLRQAPAGR